MLKYNNDHIFTGYLKQLLSSFNLPACKVYTREFAEYLEKHGSEDPRVLESFDNINDERLAVRFNYLKNDEPYHYLWKHDNKKAKEASWQSSAGLHYSPEKSIPGLTRNLHSPGIIYDTKTHEYLGDYLRFLRDYYDVNLMPLYNCFTDKIYNNVRFNFIMNPKANKKDQIKILINAQEPEYRLYALPVKLFAEYTIAVDCDQGIEMFCGLYSTNLDTSKKAEDFAARTYQRVHKTLFKQPFLYSKLKVDNWLFDSGLQNGNVRTDIYTRWDIANREKDLKLFIKVPVSCRSSITVLEGDYREYNDALYTPVKYKSDGNVFDPNVDDKNTKIDRIVWTYQQNHTVLNFGDIRDLNTRAFKPISKLQLLAFNTGESYPFSDRLIEYLSGSAITPMDEIHDNIKRVQRVMKQNNYYFKIEGLWENKMQNILYDYIMNSGPTEVVVIGNDKEKDPENFEKRILKPKEYRYKTKQILVDKRQGMYPKLGYNSKSMLFDVLGYVDKDVEKWYASWKKDGNNATVGTSLQNIDIYDGLYDI